MPMDGWYTVEYSSNQGAIHVAKIEQTIEKNLGAFRRDMARVPDYVLMGVAPTHAKALAFAEQLRRRRDDGTESQ